MTTSRTEQKQIATTLKSLYFSLPSLKLGRIALNCTVIDSLYTCGTNTTALEMPEKFSPHLLGTNISHIVPSMELEFDENIFAKMMEHDIIKVVS